MRELEKPTELLFEAGESLVHRVNSQTHNIDGLIHSVKQGVHPVELLIDLLMALTDFGEDLFQVGSEQFHDLARFFRREFKVPHLLD